MSEETADIRDQLGDDPDVFPLLITGQNETFGIEEQSTVMWTINIGNAWVVGSSTNGIVGTNTGTVGGGQQVVGGVTSEQKIRVLNPLNTFKERFRFDTFEDTTNTTATVDYTTNFRIDLTSGQVYTSDTIYANLENVNNVTAYWEGTGDVKVEASSDGGESWFEIEKNILFDFSSTATPGDVFPMTFPFTLGGEGGIGQDLRYKVTEKGSSTATITYMEIKYNT